MKITFLIALLLLTGFAKAAISPDAIIGTWLTEIKDAKVQIYKKENSYHGRVVWIAKPHDEFGKPVVDKENPDVRLKNRPILNMDILTSFVFNNGEWDGKIYDPKDGKTYQCKLWLENHALKVRGYLGWLFDTKTWSKS